MALPSSIPTSFVPKQPVTTSARRVKSGSNVFSIVAWAIFGISLLSAGGMFGYQKFLESVRANKETQLITAQKNVNQDTVEDFVRLRDRLTVANDVLNGHVGTSQFFDILESLTLQNVRFSNLEVAIAEDRSAKISMGGTAKTFNALAAQSSAFAAEKRIRRAIFSGISVDNKTGVVSFKLTGDIDAKTLILSGAPTPVESASTATTTTP